MDAQKQMKKRGRPAKKVEDKKDIPPPVEKKDMPPPVEKKSPPPVDKKPVEKEKVKKEKKTPSAMDATLKKVMAVAMENKKELAAVEKKLNKVLNKLK